MWNDPPSWSLGEWDWSHKQVISNCKTHVCFIWAFSGYPFAHLTCACFASSLHFSFLSYLLSYSFFYSCFRVSSTMQHPKLMDPLSSQAQNEYYHTNTLCFKMKKVEFLLWVTLFAYKTFRTICKCCHFSISFCIFLKYPCCLKGNCNELNSNFRRID